MSFECIFHMVSKYSNRIPECWNCLQFILHFCLVVCSRPPHCKCFKYKHAYYWFNNLQHLHHTFYDIFVVDKSATILQNKTDSHTVNVLFQCFFFLKVSMTRNNNRTCDVTMASRYWSLQLSYVSITMITNMRSWIRLYI